MFFVCVRWNLNVVFIYISFMAEDVEHFFMCCLAIWTLKKFCLVQLLISLMGTDSLGM
jgi:hypothetical protein